MSKKALIRSDNALVRNMSPIGLGTIIKAWRGSKGLDYIVVGINKETKTIYTIKHNAINQNGSIHAAVNRHNRSFKYTETPSGRFGIVKGITSVLGQKESMDLEAVEAFNTRIDDTVKVDEFEQIDLYTTPLVDRRRSTLFR